jgi:hypothetical protein
MWRSATFWKKITPFLGQGYRDAWALTRGRLTDTTREMLDEGAINVGLSTGKEAQRSDLNILRELAKFETGGAQRRYVKGIFKKIWGGLEDFATVLEYATKIAGYEALKKTNPEMSAADRAYRVRKRIGTPDAMAGGTQKHATNNLFLYSNVNAQGYRASWEAFKEDPLNFLAFSTLSMAATLPGVLATAGGLSALLTYFGWDEKDAEEIEDVYNKTISYYKKKYYVFPAGMNDSDGTPLIITIPKDYAAELSDALMYEALTQMIEKDFDISKFVSELADIVPFAPSRTQPITQVAWAFGVWMKGGNPEDIFRNRPVIPGDVYGAGKIEEAPYMIGWATEKMTGQFISKTVTETVGAVWGGKEINSMLDIPGIGRIPKQYVRRADGGEREAKRKTKQQKRQERKKAKAKEKRSEWFK